MDLCHFTQGRTHGKEPLVIDVDERDAARKPGGGPASCHRDPRRKRQHEQGADPVLPCELALLRYCGRLHTGRILGCFSIRAPHDSCVGPQQEQQSNTTIVNRPVVMSANGVLTLNCVKTVTASCAAPPPPPPPLPCLAAQLLVRSALPRRQAPLGLDPCRASLLAAQVSQTMLWSRGAAAWRSSVQRALPCRALQGQWASLQSRGHPARFDMIGSSETSSQAAV